MDPRLIGQFFVDPSLELETFKQSLFYFNFEGVRQRKVNFLSHIDSIINTAGPVLIFTGTGKISLPDELLIYLKNKRDNKKISVYLFEPMTLYNWSGQEKFYGEIPNHCETNNLRSVELDSLQDISDQYNLNLTVYLCEYGIDVIEQNYPKLLLETFDVFIRWLRISESDINETGIRKKFFCGNWRYTLHRNLVMSYIAGMDGNFTWYYKAGFGTLKNHPCFDFTKIEKHTYKKLREGIDLVNSQELSLGGIYNKVEITNFNHSYYPSFSGDRDTNLDVRKLFADNIKECFCMIVTESRFFQPLANFSEKTLNAVLFQKPFVVAAPLKTLEYLRELGFRTFDRWWNESYDQELDHQKRMLKIFSVIDHINSMDIETMKTVYLDMREVLQHNKNTLFELYNHEKDSIRQ
jgi:hypothetical protein